MYLHHCAYTIAPGYSQVIQEFCEFLGAKLIWQGYDQGREITMQFNTFAIQFSEIQQEPTTQNKQETHLAFSSQDPKADRDKIIKWFAQHDIPTTTGRWSEHELWVSSPVFLNFAIEILNTD